MPRRCRQAGVADGASVVVKQGWWRRRSSPGLMNRVPQAASVVSAAHATTAGLGDLFGAITVERA